MKNDVDGFTFDNLMNFISTEVPNGLDDDVIKMMRFKLIAEFKKTRPNTDQYCEKYRNDASAYVTDDFYNILDTVVGIYNMFELSNRFNENLSKINAILMDEAKIMIQVLNSIKGSFESDKTFFDIVSDIRKKDENFNKTVKLIDLCKVMEKAQIIIKNGVEIDPNAFISDLENLL
jgi:hypothetical protein